MRKITLFLLFVFYMFNIKADAASVLFGAACVYALRSKAGVRVVNIVLKKSGYVPREKGAISVKMVDSLRSFVQVRSDKLAVRSHSALTSFKKLFPFLQSIKNKGFNTPFQNESRRTDWQFVDSRQESKTFYQNNQKNQNGPCFVEKASSQSSAQNNYHNTLIYNEATFPWEVKMAYFVMGLFVGGAVKHACDH